MNNVENKLLMAPSSSDSEEMEEDNEQEVNALHNDHSCNLFVKKKALSKQLSMRETSREAKWENRRRQIINKRRMTATCSHGQNREVVDEEQVEKRMRGRVRSLTDEDFDELRGSIELGFGFNEEDGGHNLCDTLPALDMYFAVTRQLSDPTIRSLSSPVSTPTGCSTSSGCGCGTPSPTSPQEDSQQHNGVDWKICNPGDNPQHVKTRLRHWAQAVACSVRQFC